MFAHRETAVSGACLSDAVRASLCLGEVPRVPEQLQKDHRVGCAEGDSSLRRPHNVMSRDILYGATSYRAPLKVSQHEAGLACTHM